MGTAVVLRFGSFSKIQNRPVRAMLVHNARSLEGSLIRTGEHEFGGGSGCRGCELVWCLGFRVFT